MNELDRRIAVEVMGEPQPSPVGEDKWGNLILDGEELEGGILPWGKPAISPGGNWRIVRIYDHGDVPEWVGQPFSTNLELALGALKHFLKEHNSPGALLRTELDPTTDEPTWFCNLNWRYPNEFAYGPTLPEAICKLLLILAERVGVDE